MSYLGICQRYGAFCLKRQLNETIDYPVMPNIVKVFYVFLRSCDKADLMLSRRKKRFLGVPLTVARSITWRIHFPKEIDIGVSNCNMDINELLPYLNQCDNVRLKIVGLDEW